MKTILYKKAGSIFLIVYWTSNSAKRSTSHLHLRLPLPSAISNVQVMVLTVLQLSSARTSESAGGH